MTHRMIGALALLVLVTGCGADQEGTFAGKAGSTNVTQGGAQDFALFRSLVEDGHVPSPDTLDEVGFFAEHAIDLPAADCGDDICLHPMLAVAPRFDGGNWTAGFMAMNTPVDPSTLDRPPLHMVVLLEQSNALDYYDSQGTLALGLEALSESLRAEDALTVMMYGEDATALLEQSSDPSEVGPAVAKYDPYAVGVSPYAGLLAAKSLIDADSFGAHRIVMVGSGKSNVGITNLDHIVELGEAIAKAGTGISLVGVGDDYDITLPQALGTLGAGSYSYVAGSQEFVDVLTIEGETALFPLATDMSITIEAAPGYRVGRIYGVKRATADEQKATLALPALFIGQRDGSKDVGGGRRGGGGGLFVELIADPEASVGPNAPAFVLEATWTESDGEVGVEQPLVNSLAPAQNPEGMWPTFSHEEQGKAFMMLNMYLALRSIVELYAGGDCNRAVGLVDMMAPAVEVWQGTYDDIDIQDDYNLMLQLRANVVSHCESVTSVQPTSWGGGCFGI